MNEIQTEKETEVVAGIIEGVTQKKADTWQVTVRPDSSQYTKNLWTKDSELVTSLTAKLGQQGAFVCNASYWKRQDGQEVRSLWISSIGEDGDVPGVQNAPVTQGAPQTKADVDWDAKERRDYRSRAWAQTLGAFQHTIKVDEDPQEVFIRLQPFQRKVFQDVCQSFAFPADDSDIPFG